jgi:hypothetical protein
MGVDAETPKHDCQNPYRVSIDLSALHNAGCKDRCLREKVIFSEIMYRRKLRNK